MPIGAKQLDSVVHLSHVFTGGVRLQGHRSRSSHLSAKQLGTIINLSFNSFRLPRLTRAALQS
jgi:hypothetical protein